MAASLRQPALTVEWGLAVQRVQRESKADFLSGDIAQCA